MSQLTSAQLNMIEIKTTINASRRVVWDAYTNPSAIKQWNAASEDWVTTQAEIDLKEGGRFCYHMAAKDGSHEFDFEGIFTKIIPYQLMEYDLGGRTVWVEFVDVSAQSPDKSTMVIERFEPEQTFPAEQQQQGWQAILDNFRKYVEQHSTK